MKTLGVVDNYRPIFWKASLKFFPEFAVLGGIWLVKYLKSGNILFNSIYFIL